MLETHPDRVPARVQSQEGYLSSLHFAVAISAVNRLVTAGLERDFGGLAALRAGCGERLAGSSITGAAAAFCFSCLTAGRAALGLVSKAFLLEKFLVFGAENERRAAIAALK